MTTKQMKLIENYIKNTVQKILKEESSTWWSQNPDDSKQFLKDLKVELGSCYHQLAYIETRLDKVTDSSSAKKFQEMQIKLEQRIEEIKKQLNDIK